MTSAAHQDAYGPNGWNQGRNYGPWGNTQGSQQAGGPQQQAKGQAWGPNSSWSGSQWPGAQTWTPPFWHPAGMSRPVAIAFTVLGFMFWWPVGLALLIYMVGSGRMGCFGRRRREAMNQGEGGPFGAWKSWASGAFDRPAASSGNRAFDEYKADTLRRMEEEQKEFGAFLDRLRFAKDKSEFDQFMAERRGRPPATPADEQPAA